MLSKRIIACLDVRNGQVVKGINFEGLRSAGDPAALARRYNVEGIDELVILDITATLESRRALADTIHAVAKELFIPLAVGGGIRTLEDIRELLLAGSDKVSINSAAPANPEFVRQAARRFGSQCIVVNIDPKRVQKDGREVWEVHTHGGRPTQRFDVSVLDGAGTYAECTDPDQWVSSTNLSITYNPGGLTLRVWIDPDVQVGQRRAIVDFGSGPPVTLHKPYWLRIPNSADAVYTLTSVSIEEIGTGRTVTCSLGADGQVKVYQRRK